MSSLSASNGVISHSPPLSTAWGHFQREILLVSWAVTELALITPICLALMPWARFWPPASVMLWLLLIMLFSFNLVRLMSLLQVKHEHQRNVMVSALMLTLLIMLPMLLYRPRALSDLSWISSFVGNLTDAGNVLWTRDLSVFLVTILVWWRGIRLSHQAFSIERAGLRLRLGGLVGGPLVAWAGGRVAMEVTPYILLFFFSAITVVALVRAEQIEQDRSAHSASLNPRWLSGIVVVDLAVVLFAGLLAALFSGDSALVVVGWMSPLWSALAFGAATTVNIVGYLSQPLFLVLAFIIEWLSILLRRLLSNALAEPLTLPILEVPIPQPTPQGAEQAESFIDGSRAIALLLMVALVLVTGLTLGRLYRHTTPADGEQARISGTHGQKESRDASLRTRLLQRLGLLRRRRMATSIRRIYQEMCDAASASGYPRALSETPYEYVATLANVWPDNYDDIWRVTQAYIRVRYGEIPETKEAYEQISAAWHRLKHTRPASLAQETVYAELER